MLVMLINHIWYVASLIPNREEIWRLLLLSEFCETLDVDTISLVMWWQTICKRNEAVKTFKLITPC